MRSESSKEFKDAYFTSLDDAKWCIEKLSDLYELEGKIALEPAAGSGVFLRASKKTGLNWVTNELHPQFAQGYEADFNIDFVNDDRSELGRFDFIIGNPPFGDASRLAKKFLKYSMEMTDVVAMILPKGLRRHTYWDKSIPRDFKIVVDEVLPGQTFDLPNGKPKKWEHSFW